jgi:iron-sulfur cluster assembly protein
MTTSVEIAISLTPAAATKLQNLIEERGESESGLRIFVSGGGCSGMQYGMAIENDIRESDQVLSSQGIKLIVDPNSLMYLAGSEVDYVDNMMGGGFAINNPNAISTCGCGHSFQTGESQ